MADRPKTDQTSLLRQDISAEVMAKLQAAYKASGSGSTRACPDPETVISYALEELPQESRAQVHAHLSECKHCLDLVLDLRAAWHETQERKQEVREGVPISVQTQSWLARLVEGVKDFLSRIAPLPRLIPAVAALGILAVISLGLYQHLTTPISIQLKLIGQDSGLLTRGMSEANEIPIPKGGVLRSGDRFQVVFTTSKDAYVYVFFQDNTGKITRLYSGKVLRNKPHKLPSENKWFKLDEKTGKEEVLVMATKIPIVKLDEVVQQLTEEGIGGLRKSYPQSAFQSFTFKHE